MAVLQTLKHINFVGNVKRRDIYTRAKWTSGGLRRLWWAIKSALKTSEGLVTT